ncbi:MAG: ACT domain-containing protein, partial [Eubacteriaceae bacterium]
QTAPDEDRSDYAFIIDGSDFEVAQRIAERVTASDPHYIAKANRNITRLSLSGIGMRTQSGVAAKFFQVLADSEVPVRMITTSEIRIAVVIADEDAPRAVKAIKNAFDL